MKGANKRLDGLDDKMDGLKSGLDAVIERLDKKYASKWVEKAMAGMIAVILLAFLYAVVNDVIPDKTTNAQQVQR